MATSRLSTRRVEWRVQVGTSNKPGQGLVIFEASVSYIPDPLAAGGPRTAIPEPVAAVLDAGGYACTPDPTNPAKAGERGAELFTTDSLGEDGGDWTWTARPQLRSANGIQMTNAVPAFSFAVPTGTGSLDLAKVQKVPASPGLGTEQAVALVAAAQQALEEVKGAVLEGAGDAAAAAVSEEVEKAQLVRSTDPRIPQVGQEDAFLVMNADGGVPFRVEGDSTFVGNTEVVPDEVFSVVSKSGHLLFSIDPVSGKVYAPNLYANSFQLAGAPASGAGSKSVTRVIINCQLGQSNGEGRAKPYGGALDPADSRIDMYHWPTGELRTATVPLSSQQQQTGLSVITEVSRHTLRREPEGTVVVILNAAVGNSPLVGATAAIGSWNTAYTGSEPHLAEIALSALDATIAAATRKYGLAPEVRLFWHQGEADSNYSAYVSALDALISVFRAKYGPTVPFTLGGMVPEYIKSATGRDQIRRAHIQTPARHLVTAYADGIPNGGGSANTGDIVHYGRAGVETLGADMYEAYRRALANTAGSVPVPPPVVNARQRAGSLIVSWEQPFCRVTGYKLEHSADGESWTTVPAPAVALETSASIASTAAYVRISTINENGTSAPTTPVIALGA